MLNDFVDVDVLDKPYKIHIGEGVLSDFNSLLPENLKSAPLFFVCDENTQVYAKNISGGQPLYVVKAGEDSKSFSELQNLVSWALDNKIDRHSVLVAIGGGVIGDLAGFAASIILRGISVIQIPTTLLAMVDSSVGGKTGINSSHGKNLIGAFHQPSLVLCDLDVLKTLPEREIKAGYAEVLKYGLLGNEIFYAWLQQNGQDVLDLKPEAVKHAVRVSCEMKAQIVKEDERETSGRRALLNLGHTFGHVFEAEMGYDGRLLHGEAVSVGMVCAIDLSIRKGWLDEHVKDSVLAHMKQLGLKYKIADIGIPKDTDFKKLYKRMFSDKKAKAGKINFVVLKEIGESFQSNEISEDDIVATLTSCY